MTIRRPISLIVSIVAMAGVLCGAFALAVQVLPPTSGAVVATAGAGSVYSPQGPLVVPLPGAITVFEHGDIVTAIAGSSLQTWPVATGDVPPDGIAGATVTVPASVIRADQPLELVVPLTPYPLADVVVANAGSLAFVVLLFLAAVYVFAKRPRALSAAGLLLFGAGAMGSTPAYLAGVDPLAFARGTATLTWVIVAVVYYLIWAGIIHFAMAFPRPHPWVEHRPWLTATPYVLVYAGLAGSIALAVALDPGGLAFIDLALGLLGNLVVVAAMIVAGGFMVSAWRRSEGEERRMLRGLFLAALMAMAGGALLGFIPEIVVGHPLLPWSVLAVTGLPFVVALALAVLRHRAFDIEVVIRRSLVYGGMTVVVLGIYVAAVSVLGVVLREDADYAIALLATALAALAALPARDILQRAVDRALYGDRDEPVRAMRRLGDRLTWTLEPEAMPEVIVGTIADSLRLPYVALETGGAETAHIVAARGRPPADTGDIVALPLVARSAPVGRLLLGSRAPSEPLSRADRRLLDDLARQVGPAVDNLALIDALRRSRERIIVAGEEERRRLRRDLHDGLGPALAAVGMRAEAAARLIDEDPERARTMLAEVHAGVRAAVVDVRRLVEGLRPPALDELGLVGAIRQQAERLGVEAPTFVIDEAPLGELPAAVEVAAYRIAVEAMTNVVRHAGAARCRIRVMTDGDGVARRLRLEIVDDGSGLPPQPAAGVGLASMRERASEVGGEVRIEDVPSGGTRVQAWLPLGSP